MCVEGADWDGMVGFFLQGNTKVSCTGLLLCDLNVLGWPV